MTAYPSCVALIAHNVVNYLYGFMRSLNFGYRNVEIIGISKCTYADGIAIIAGGGGYFNENLTAWNHEVLLMNGMNNRKPKLL